MSALAAPVEGGASLRHFNVQGVAMSWARASRLFLSYNCTRIIASSPARSCNPQCNAPPTRVRYPPSSFVTLAWCLRSPLAGPSLSPQGESDGCVRFQIIHPGFGPAFGPDPKNLSHQYQSIATVFAPSLHRTP